MTAQNTPYPRRIMRLLEDRDLAGLIQILRQSADADLRAAAAAALGETGETGCTEALVRSTLEDPAEQVRRTARAALDLLLGGQAELAIAVQRSSTPHDAWLLVKEPAEGSDEEAGGDENDEGDNAAEAEDGGPALDELSQADVEGFARVATYEGNEKLRLQAIRILSRSSDMRATDTLATLALWGDTRRLREAARAALEKRYGEQAADIIESYRESAIEDAAVNSPDLDADDLFLDEDEEFGEEEDLEDEEDGEYEDYEDEDEDAEDEPNSAPSPYPQSGGFLPSANDARGGRPAVEEMGPPWKIILLAVLVIAVLLIILSIGKFL